MSKNYNELRDEYSNFIKYYQEEYSKILTECLDNVGFNQVDVYNNKGERGQLKLFYDSKYKWLPFKYYFYPYTKSGVLSKKGTYTTTTLNLSQNNTKEVIQEKLLSEFSLTKTRD